LLFLIFLIVLIGIDACHLKGKWNGFLVAATTLDGNNWMFPVAFGVMENKSEESWEWFLKALNKAIGMSEGLVISSDMQKGLVKVVLKVFPLAEHRECMRHLYKNFKKRFSGKPIKAILWAAARTCSPMAGCYNISK
jgi:transposase-like protein